MDFSVCKILLKTRYENNGGLIYMDFTDCGIFNEKEVFEDLIDLIKINGYSLEYIYLSGIEFSVLQIEELTTTLAEECKIS